jgi:hypothetical protein
MPVRRARPLWFWYLPSVLLLVVAGNQLALRLTLLDILLRPIGNWFLQPLLLCYLVAFGLILFYREVPWTDWLLRFSRAKGRVWIPGGEFSIGVAELPLVT